MKKERIKHSKKLIMRRLMKYLLEYKWLLLLALLLMIASNVLSLAGPELAGRAIDCIAGKGRVDFEGVYVNAFKMLGVYVISAIFSYALTLVMTNASKKITYNMRRDLFTHLSRLPASFYDGTLTGDIVSRITYDIDTINASISHDVLQIGASAITVIGAFVMMCKINLNLLVVFIVTVPVAVWFTSYKTKKVEPLFKRRSKSLGELNGYAEEMMSGLRSIKAYGAEQSTLSKFDTFNKNAVDAYYTADYHACVVGPCVNFINNISLALISVLGSMLYLCSSMDLSQASGILLFFRGGITLGSISSFLLYSRKFSGPINEAANILSELQSAFAAADRVFDVLDTPAEKQDDKDAVVLENASGNIDIRDVTFGYTKDKKVLEGLNLSVKKGSVIAIVGPTGAGKTTIINLLMRFYDPDSGKILVDGTDMTKITRSSLRKSYTMVLQDTWLFSGSVFENIAYGKEGATLEDVKEVAKKAHIDDFIEGLENGYDTILNDDGVSISKGQKQLITIARAMLNDSSMLILDEATSNVDSRTEIKISDAMTALMKDKTCFIIAHRLSTVKNADCILVVNDGRIVESGKHGELLQKGGFYSSIYNAQFA